MTSYMRRPYTARQAAHLLDPVTKECGMGADGLGLINATARGALGWKHTFNDVTPLSTQAFAGSDTFTIAGVPIARDSVRFDAGLDLDLSPAATFGLSYNSQIAAGAQQHGFKANLAVRF